MLMLYCSGLTHDDFRSIESYQKVNRFPEVDEITRKDNLHYSISRMSQLYGKNHFDFIPQSKHTTILFQIVFLVVVDW